MPVFPVIDDIVRYLAYLKNDCHLSVSVHFRAERLAALPGELLLALIPYNRHENPYCMAVKKDKTHACLLSQKEILSGEGMPCFRICHAGVYEHITPVLVEEETVGFIAVSGHRKEGTLPPVKDGKLWETALSDAPFPEARIAALIPPLQHMLSTLFSKYARGEGDEFGLWLTYIHDCRGSVTLNALCDRFHRSRSYISRLFNERAGTSLSSYCNHLKLLDAEALLKSTRLSVTEIAYAVGFGDTSYFIKLFKEKQGVSPLSYRKGI